MGVEARLRFRETCFAKPQASFDPMDWSYCFGIDGGIAGTTGCVADDAELSLGNGGSAGAVAAAGVNGVGVNGSALTLPDGGSAGSPGTLDVLLGGGVAG